MDEAIGLLENAMVGINTGRVRSALLEPIRVEAYGDVVSIGHVATVGRSSKDPRSLVVSPFDPALLGKIMKAIQVADLGLNPQRAGTTLLVGVPQPDQDQKKKLESRAKVLSEQQRVAIRNVRKDVRNQAKRENCLERIQKPLDELTKQKADEVESLLRAKVEEIYWVDSRWNKR